MNEEEALIAAVLLHPEDDTPRLVYADWLDESGEEDKAARAALIRVQCGIAALPPFAMVIADTLDGDQIAGWRVSGTLTASPAGIVRDAVVDWEANALGKGGLWSGTGVVESVGQDRHGLRVQIRPLEGPQRGSRADRDALHLRERQLLDWFNEQDLAPEFGLPCHSSCYVCGEGELMSVELGAYLSVRRGFVEAVRLPWAAWRDHGDAILGRHPVAKVELTTCPPLPPGRVGGGNLHRKAIAALSARWPSVPAGGWTLPPERPVYEGDFSAASVPLVLSNEATGDLIAYGTTLTIDGVRVPITNASLSPDGSTFVVTAATLPGCSYAAEPVGLPDITISGTFCGCDEPPPAPIPASTAKPRVKSRKATRPADRRRFPRPR